MRGDPESALLGTAKSGKTLRDELSKPGFRASIPTVLNILKQEGYSLPANAKTQEGRQNPDRDQQFQPINAEIKAFLQDNQPVISVDTKQKALVGNFKNTGRTWRPKGQPDCVTG